MHEGHLTSEPTYTVRSTCHGHIELHTKKLYVRFSTEEKHQHPNEETKKIEETFSSKKPRDYFKYMFNICIAIQISTNGVASRPEI